MDLPLLPEKSEDIEKYVEDTIIEYLQSQNDAIEESSYDFEKINAIEQAALDEETREKQKILFTVEEVLENLLQEVDRTILCRQEYTRSQKAHHQYALFDLRDIVPDCTQLDDTLIRRLCFRETLLISNVDELDERNSSPKPVGGLCLKVELVRGLQPETNITEKQIEENIEEKIKEFKKQLAVKTPTPSKALLKQPETEEMELQRYKEFLEDKIRQTPHKFVVHLSSEFDVDGDNAGSRIISWVDKNFHTMEERRTEYFYGEPKEEKRLYFALLKDKYYIKYRDCSEGVNKDIRKYYSLSKTKDLIGEGANFILMRYLAITRYRGVFELSTIYINGDMCRNIYECRGPKPGFVNGHPVDLCKIYRTIMEECGIMHLSVTVLTVYGMIVSQEWEGCPYIVHINPEFVTHGKPVPYDYIALKKVWETNMELVSKYLDCKVEAEFKMQTFIRDHQELQDMLADYLQSVLLLKPENVMQFTKDYFMNLEPYSLPETPYFTKFDDNQDQDQDETHMYW